MASRVEVLLPLSLVTDSLWRDRCLALFRCACAVRCASCARC
jgi:hypothetical protein